MRRIIIAFLAVCITLAATAQQRAEDTAAGTISGNQFQSAFFKFQYEFPKGWTYLDLDKMRAENVEASRRAAEKSLKEHGPDSTTVSGNTTTTRTTKLFGNSNLLIAGPAKIETSETNAVPRVRVWAHERVPGMLNDAGDHAKLIAKLGYKVVMPTTEIAANGHKFVRIDVLHSDGQYHSFVETVCGEYIVGFDFYARTPEELRALAETVNTVRFD